MGQNICIGLSINIWGGITLPFNLKTMGYYSDFEILFNKKELTVEQQVEILDFLENDNDLGIITDAIKEDRDKDSAYYTDKLLPEQVDIYYQKWYNHLEDLLRLSKQFPYLKIELQREGEDRLDIEKSHYFNGNRQVCTGELKFDENELW